MTDTPTPAPQPTPAPAPNPTPAPQPVKPWYDGKADAETIGYWQNRGWADKAPDVVALEATKAAREAQGYVGVPADRLVKLPADQNDAAGWQAVWQKLGAPQDGKYDFANIKFADGTDLDEKFTGAMAAAFAAQHLPANQARATTEAFVKFMDSVEKDEAAQQALRVATQKQTLQQNWGQNFEANKFIAGQAAQKLGFTPEQVQAFENMVGYDKVMEMFRAVGQTMGEGRYIAGGGPGQNGPMTMEQAKARLSELKADVNFRQRYFNKDAAAVKEMNDLQTLIWRATPDN